VRGGAAAFDGDTAAAERALGALASPVLVLDEVDAGTGARLGASVAQLLLRLAASCGQVLCVTHVPQVRGVCPSSIGA
jgi:DNA repair ATPase RecN